MSVTDRQTWWEEPDNVVKDQKGSTSLCVSSPVLFLHTSLTSCLHLFVFPPLPTPFLSLSTPSAFFFLPCLPSSHSRFLLYPPVFYYQVPVISLDIKKYTSTEQLWAIKKNRFSPGPCECCTVDAWRWDEEEASEQAHLSSAHWSTTKIAGDCRTF